MHILNIAEKPSVAKSISLILSQSVSTQRGRHKYCPNNTFKYGNDTFVFTSVLGHIYNLNFIKKYKWEAINPIDLFDEPLTKNILDDFMTLKQNLQEQVIKADKVIIWTDCDREGENIGKQISNIILEKKNVEIKRARFTGICRSDILNALNNLTIIDENESDAVDCRMELDLRIGSSFTILQTLSIKNLFDTKKIISFGPCQIPTLGFVVDRYFQIEDFKAEKMYTLDLLTGNDTWAWKRGYVFDKNCTIHFYNHLNKFKPIIIKKETRDTLRYKPLPLRTVELQKICSAIFKVSSHKVMEIAEKLYNKGYISYPRTETDSFAKNFNFKNILKKLQSDNIYSEKVSNIINSMKIPRCGRNNDMAHSPIYPLKHGNDLVGLDRSIYDFIISRFLGSLCDDARGIETYYELSLDKEIFYIKGLVITERNYLDVYTYDKWNDKNIGIYNEIKDFNLEISESVTTPPKFLTESELIELMDKNEIGTDATIHEHIQKIQERGYAKKVKMYILPTKLGIGLIKFYKEFNMEVNKPILRKHLECNLKKISNNDISKDEVIESEKRIYIRLYNILNDNIERFKEIINGSISSRNDLLDKWHPNKDESSSDDGDKKAKHTLVHLEYKKKHPVSKHDDIESVKKKPKADKSIKNNFDKENAVMCKCEKPARYCNNESKLYYKCHYEPNKCNYTKTEIVKCQCGFEPKVLMSFTEANKNRKFYKCNKSYKPCKFFKWAESLDM